MSEKIRGLLEDGWIKARKGDGFAMYNVNQSRFWNLDSFKASNGKRITDILRNRAIDGYPVYELSFRPDINKRFFKGENNMACFNTFSGYAIDAIEGDCSIVLNHLKEVWANDDNDLYVYIIKWLAHLIQCPGIKIGTALAMNGQEGSGKGCIMNLLREIIGSKYMLATSDNSVVNKNFNSEMETKLLIFFDEIGWTEKDCEGKLKQWITEPYITTEGKGIDRKEIKSFHNFIFTTNNIRIMNLSKTDRRYVIFKTSNRYCGDPDYFKPFFDKEKRRILVAAFYDYLLKVDITGWNPAIFPCTAERWEQINLSRNKVESWVNEYTPFYKKENIYYLRNPIEVPDINNDLQAGQGWIKKSDILEEYKSNTGEKVIRYDLFWRYFNEIFETEKKSIKGYPYIKIINETGCRGVEGVGSLYPENLRGVVGVVGRDTTTTIQPIVPKYSNSSQKWQDIRQRIPKHGTIQVQETCSLISNT
jgi:hypothetical protein